MEGERETLNQVTEYFNQIFKPLKTVFPHQTILHTMCVDNIIRLILAC